MTSLEDWNAGRLDRYLEALEEGHHDAHCEQRARSSLCHCHKRARIARGLTEPPDEDLYFPPPTCPACDGDLDNDAGDAWRCYPCALSWSMSGYASTARFDDEYGDIGGEQFGERMWVLAKETP